MEWNLGNKRYAGNNVTVVTLKRDGEGERALIGS